MKNVGMMLTQYERFGSVGMDEYIQYYIDEELEVDAGMIGYYNEYLRDNQYYDDEYMNWDELGEYLEGMKPLEVFKLAVNSDFNWNCDYFNFNGYGNLRGYEEYEVVKKMEDDKDFLKWYVENYIDIDEDEANEAIEEANKLIQEGY